MKLVLIPAGKFLMGSPAAEAERDPEELQHEVTITQAVLPGRPRSHAGAVSRRSWARTTSHFNAKNGGGPDHPVEQVRWKEAVEFCNELSELAGGEEGGPRLPPADRGRVGIRLPGRHAPRRSTSATTLSSNAGELQRQLSLRRRRQGAVSAEDREGRLLRAERLGPVRHARQRRGVVLATGTIRTTTRTAPRKTRQGPAKGVVGTGFAKDFFRVVRGGCWLDEARGCRAAYRFRLQSSEPYRLVGFRVVCERA